jgi:hypothetical protein
MVCGACSGRIAKKAPRGPELICDAGLSSNEIIGDGKNVAQVSDDIAVAVDVSLSKP